MGIARGGAEVDWGTSWVEHPNATARTNGRTNVLKVAFPGIIAGLIDRRIRIVVKSPSGKTC
jgi:hypothetical protein